MGSRQLDIEGDAGESLDIPVILSMYLFFYRMLKKCCTIKTFVRLIYRRAFDKQRNTMNTSELRGHNNSAETIILRSDHIRLAPVS